ncbi:magnesium transporter CorA family protein [Streptococcus pseudoporcinus]|uniref:CorA-like Mg2+ transporter protein n=1 Tax=Streptococcus pseudoporcinus TaxID=361101 RepID=A0A4U9XIC3_9STRE|nr:magnesium transporter CorA family protein [Streptococcus pseudoporcinus]VTS12709.1 CorA-like Mg2+ transporter protein [Streptococcus pseudoporcinus]VUC65419.1 CorA-like Mg2+ transporter protein [Streptococcus pseudoporcinus]VUC96314.1 CorA-like Mg2+ transporter protein [Streptococcus pseudoporcinus]VUC96708.1 CorA-like Mg2+ transporter protein [Streptococcus pseudoporcinus]
MSGETKTQDLLKVINVDHLSTDDKQLLMSLGDLGQDVLDYAQDSNETAFVKEQDGWLVLVYQLLEDKIVSLKAGNIPKIMPMTFVVSSQSLLILETDETTQLLAKVIDRVNLSQEPKEIMLQLLTLFTKSYFTEVEAMGKERDYLMNQLRQRATKKNLTELANLQSGSVYVMMGSQQNGDMLADFQELPSYDSFSERVKAKLRDTVIEVKQLSNMCSLHTRILEQLASSYNNVLSNRLNDNVTSLTIFTIGLTVITTVTSFYGMNVKLPFAGVDIVWLLILIITIIIALILMHFLRRFVNDGHRHL